MIRFEEFEYAYEPTVIFRADEKFLYGREPTLRRMHDGSLISFVYSGGEGEPSPDKNIAALIRSYDDGKTWSKPEIVFQNPHRSVWGTEIFTETEKPLAFFNTFIYETRYLELRAFMARTEDSGKTWSEPECVKGFPANAVFRQGKVLGNGSWLFPVYWVESRHKWNEVADAEFTHEYNKTHPILYLNWFASGAAISNDQGKSFSLHGYVMNEAYMAWEPEVVELENKGHLLMYIRSDFSGVLWKSESFDYGITWSKMEKTDIPNPGAKFVIYKVRDSYVLFTNVCDAPNKRTRYTLEMWVSYDYCKTWRLKSPLVRNTGETQRSVTYPHGFADDNAECIYLSIDSGKFFTMIKVPYSDILK